jgi:CRISPR type III-A-associated protein Csm2
MEEVQPEATHSETTVQAEAPAQAQPPAPPASPAASSPAAGPKPEPQKSQGPKREDRSREDRPREDRAARPPGENRGGENRGGERRDNRGERPDRGRPGGDRGGERRESGGRPGGGRPFEGPAEIELEKLISDSLYLDNQAHAVVVRMRDMDSGTKSQLRRLYNAVRRAVRAPESERQHQFVMLRARLAYTIARHSLRSLDALERLLLQVTRKNDARGYERFKDLFEAIVAYNE